MLDRISLDAALIEYARHADQIANLLALEPSKGLRC